MSAWSDGYDAFDADGSDAKNPHDQGSDKFHEWECGAGAAQDDDDYWTMKDE